MLNFHGIMLAVRWWDYKYLRSLMEMKTQTQMSCRCEGLLEMSGRQYIIYTTMSTIIDVALNVLNATRFCGVFEGSGQLQD